MSEWETSSEDDLLRQEIASLRQRVKELEAIIHKVKPYIVTANHKAEARHDSTGEYYLDGVQYEIMQETEKLIAAIDAAMEASDD